MKKSTGFTLLELMVVLSIVAILTMMAASSLKQMIQSATMSSNVNTFMADMRYARSESIRRGGGLVMCRSTNPEAADANCSNDSAVGWESGWIIFLSKGTGDTRNSDEPLLRVQGAITGINTIAETGAASPFKFTGTGRRLNLNDATQLQFGKAPLYATDAQRIVCVNQGGRTRIAFDSEGRPTGNAKCGADK